MSILPVSSEERKLIPLASGLFDYFTSALIEVAKLSVHGNRQHHDGQPLHWNRAQSSDHDDALLRHFTERGGKDTDGIRHRTKLAWRALAGLQEELEAQDGAPLPRNARYVPPEATVAAEIDSLLPVGSKPGEE